MIELVGKRVEEVGRLSSFVEHQEIESALELLFEKEGFAASIDGLLGMQSKLPLSSVLKNFVSAINKIDQIGVRVAVDIPTGVGEESTSEEALRADFTYATGIAKTPIFIEENQKWTGRLR